MSAGESVRTLFIDADEVFDDKCIGVEGQHFLQVAVGIEAVPVIADAHFVVRRFEFDLRFDVECAQELRLDVFRFGEAGSGEYLYAVSRQLAVFAVEIDVFLYEVSGAGFVVYGDGALCLGKERAGDENAYACRQVPHRCNTLRR